jgi:outer membrane protein insertion porin family
MAFLLFIPLHGVAQKFQPKTIQFKGAADYSDQELLAAAGLKKGNVITSAEMGDDTTRLADSGVFDNVGFKFDGQDLIFFLKPATMLYPIHLDNLPLKLGADLDARLHDRFPLYHGKVPAEGTLLDGVRRFFEETLAAEGIKTTVVAIPTGVAGSRKITEMTFQITSSTVRVGAIRLEGISPAMQDKVRFLAQHTVRSPFDTENAGENLEHKFASLYADEGYAAAKVNAAWSGDPVAALDAIDVPFVVTVEEGKAYKLSAIHIPPDALVTQAEIDKTVQLRSDGHFKGVTLSSAWSSIVSRYKAKGHLDCKVTPHPEFDEASGTVSYSVDIDPGPVYHLAYVKFENATDELRSRLMRSWQMLPGDPFDATYVSNFIVKAENADPPLQRMLAGLKFSFDVQADPDSREVNCVIRFEKPQQLP